MIKDAKEEKEMKKEIQKEAKLEAREEIKEILKQQYIDKEKAKATNKGKGSGFLNKLGAEFKDMGDSVGKKDIGAMMGMGRESNEGSSIISNEKISNMLGGKTPSNKTETFGKSPVSDEKIRRMLGR